MHLKTIALKTIDEAKITKCLHVFRRLVGDSPSYMNSLLTRNADVHSRESRHRDFNLVCPRFKRETEGGRSFSVSTTIFWNSLPRDVKSRSSLLSLSKALTGFFY